MKTTLNLSQYINDNLEGTVSMEAAYDALDNMFSESTYSETANGIVSLFKREEKNLDDSLFHLDLLSTHFEDLHGLSQVGDKEFTQDEALAHVIKMNGNVFESGLAPVEGGLGLTVNDLFEKKGDMLVLNNKASEERKGGVFAAIKRALSAVWETMKRITYDWLNPRGRIVRQLKAITELQPELLTIPENSIPITAKMDALLVSERGKKPDQLASGIDELINNAFALFNHKDLKALNTGFEILATRMDRLTGEVKKAEKSKSESGDMLELFDECVKTHEELSEILDGERIDKLIFDVATDCGLNRLVNDKGDNIYQHPKGSYSIAVEVTRAHNLVPRVTPYIHKADVPNVDHEAQLGDSLFSDRKMTFKRLAETALFQIEQLEKKYKNQRKEGFGDDIAIEFFERLYSKTDSRGEQVLGNHGATPVHVLSLAKLNTTLMKFTMAHYSSLLAVIKEVAKVNK